MRIILINPPISLDDVYGRFKKLASFQPPVGLASLAGYLLKYKHDVSIVDLVFGKEFTKAIESKQIAE